MLNEKWPTCKRCGWDGVGEDPSLFCGPSVTYQSIGNPNEIFIAHNICMKCNFVWHSKAGPGSHCPNPVECDSLYWTWMNYPIDKPNWCEICKAEFI